MEAQVTMEEKTYRLSRAGRRMAYLLLAGSILIWGFALWTLKNTLKIGLRPQNILPSLNLLAKRILGFQGTQPLTAEEAIPAIIMLVLAIVVPLLIWNIVEELRSSYTVGPGGITFRSWGIQLSYPWTEITALHPVDEETEEPLDELIVRTSRLPSIRSGLARFLHWQAYGRNKLPLYSGLEERDDLLARIRTYIAANREIGTAAGPAGAGEGTDRTEGPASVPEGLSTVEGVVPADAGTAAPPVTGPGDGQETV